MKHGTVVNRYCLTKPGSSKSTWHVELDISNCCFSFRPGDSLGIFPKNPMQQVEDLLAYFRLAHPSMVFDPRVGRTLHAQEWLQNHVEINKVSDGLAQKVLQPPVDKALYDGYDVPNFLRHFAPKGIALDEIAPLFSPIRPRLYSIASGPSVKGHTIDLTVAHAHFTMHGRSGHGVCSHYLTQTAPLGIPEVRVFLQPTNHFTFPADARHPVVMIGPGTGVAPFRAFMQEVDCGAISKTPCWLFFGERHRATDFLYEDFWLQHVKKGQLRLDLAFSRDQPDKIYVHHKLWEHRAELWQWMEEGARIYVCGDAKHMAKDIDRCLCNIVCNQTSLSQEDGVHFLKKLRSDGRYLRDVY